MSWTFPRLPRVHGTYSTHRCGEAVPIRNCWSSLHADFSPPSQWLPFRGTERCGGLGDSTRSRIAPWLMSRAKQSAQTDMPPCREHAIATNWQRLPSRLGVCEITLHVVRFRLHLTAASTSRSAQATLHSCIAPATRREVSRLASMHVPERAVESSGYTPLARARRTRNNVRLADSLC